MAVEFEGRHDPDHSSKKFKILQGRSYLVPIYRPVLLCLLIFITVACFYYNSDDPMSYFAVPKTMKSTSKSPHIAVCLVGGARRFELTGPSILKHVLNVFPEADLFVHTNLDDNAFKLGLLKSAPRVAEVRIRKPVTIPETDERKRVLWPSNIGIQALLQYFDLVEGCLDMIRTSESNGNFTYDWIVRARADAYWMGPLDSRTFNGSDSSYIVPEGSRYNGLNDRLGVGNRSSSQVALSRMSLIPALDAAGYRNLNSESSFHAQLKVYNVSAEERKFPFCILTDRSCNYPPRRWDLPVTALTSAGPLNGAYCQPCVPRCKGECLEQVTKAWDGSFSWIEWRNGTIELCDARHPWQDGWEAIFDGVAGEVAANERRRFKEMKAEECVTEMEALRAKSDRWNGPDPAEVCSFRFQSKN